MNNAITSLGARRSLFHSEADFQFALAWEVQKADNEISVYLEAPIDDFERQKREHLDVLFERSGHFTALELKYLTRTWSGDIPHLNGVGQSYALKNHSAHDHRRYDVVKDIVRVEKFVQSHPNANGAVVVLTNDPAYTKPSSGSTANDAAFRIGHGDVLHGPREWGRLPANKERQNGLRLGQSYEMKWSEFSTLGGEPLLWQLVVEVAATPTIPRLS